MSTIVKRITKGTTLTLLELDANINNLNSGKLEVSGGTLTGRPKLANQDIDIIEPKYPTIKPSLNLDFVSSRQLDPRITFARNSTAAYYDGKTTAKAEENLLLQSQAFGTAPWGVSGSSLTTNEIAPDGTSTASLFTCLSQYNSVRTTIPNISGLVAGTTYTVSLWVKSNVGANVYTIFLDTTNTIVGTITPTATWTRYSFSFVYPAGATTFNLLQDRNASGFGSVYLWGAQLEQRSSVTAYTPTTTAPITNYIPVLKFAQPNVPRLDYDPITGKALGLLIEESRTNLLTYSTDFNTSTNWLLIRASKIANAIVAPDGTQTGIKLIGNTTPISSHWLSDYYTRTVTAGSSYTFSVYLKAGEYNYATLYPNVSNAGTLGYPVFFNLTTGEVSQTNYAPSGHTNILSSSVNVGNGWWRISITAYALCSSIDVHPAIGVVSVGTGATDGADVNTQNGYSGIYVWGPQFEANGSSLAIRNSTIGTGSTTTDIVLDAGASAVDGTYVGNRITYSGLQEIRTISAYVGATKTASVSVAASAAPISGASYTIVPATMTASGFATSYIPTTTGAVTRVADQAYMTGTNFSSWYNASEWSVCVKADCFATGFPNNPCIFSISDLGGGVSNKINIDFGNRTFNYTNGVNNYVLTSLASGLALNTFFKFATSVKPNLVYGIGSGGTIKTSTAMTSMPQNIVILRLYDNTLLNGHIKKLTYYPKALTSTELVALTS
jgi:hypothetical protein